jgi:hypothetical protein
LVYKEKVLKYANSADKNCPCVEFVSFLRQKNLKIQVVTQWENGTLDACKKMDTYARIGQ